MKTARLIELNRQRLALFDEARDALTAIEAADPKDVATLEARHDEIMRKIDHNRIDIDEEELRGSSDDRSQRRPGATPGYGVRGDSGEIVHTLPAALHNERAAWSDDRGNAVRVLGPADPFATERAAPGELGNTLRAAVCGARNEAEKRALTIGSDSAGGYTVPEPLAAEFIDRLRAKSVVNRAGARTVQMTSSTMAIAKLTGDPSVAWRAEGGSIAESDPTFGRVTLEAKSLACIVKVSRELMADTVNAGQMIEQALIAAAALELDRAAVFGTGADNSPTGITSTSGINEVSMGTNGAAFSDYDKLIDAIYELHLDNVEQVTAGIMHPRTGASMAKLKDGNGMPATVPKMVADIPLLTTTAASIAETQGISSVASSIVYGDYSKLLIGMREEINIRVLQELYAGTGHVGILLHMRADVQLAHAAAFCRLKGITVA